MHSGIAVDVILRVMRAESGGNPGIVSPKGAIGCMQIMPATWAYLSPRYSLGSDPYDARMNMIGGALYLAELARRFGWPGAYAAYNAGPARYIRYVANGVPLPTETMAYAARLGGAAAPAIAAIPRARWHEARLFLDCSDGDPEAADTHTLKLAIATKKAGASPTSIAAPPKHGSVSGSSATALGRASCSHRQARRDDRLRPSGPSQRPLRPRRPRRTPPPHRSVRMHRIARRHSW